MRVTSLNVGLPRLKMWQGRPVETGIFKEPVTGPLELRFHNFAGDRQADLSVHGGVAKAVYAYPSEYYGPWSERLRHELQPGAFGENLTTEGLIESEVFIGDEFRIGTAVLVARQPRLPCFKLGLRFDDARMVKTFMDAALPGIYFSIKEEGVVAPGDSITCIHRDNHKLSISSLFALIADKHASVDDLKRALDVPALTDNWRQAFSERLGA